MRAEPSTAAVTVLVPTIGRRELLHRCVASLAACRPRAAEILIVDQSPDEVGRAVLEGIGLRDARVLRSSPPGIARALNVGLRAAAHPHVLVTHDDCTVAADWVAVGRRLLADDDHRIVTGRVLAPEGAGHVPSTIDHPDPRHYDDPLDGHVLFPNNMALSPARVLALGGFDERFATAAEDNDLCFRWLASGRPIDYDPALVVWHHDWRGPAELRRLYVGYWEAQGRFYAKHLRADRRIVAYLRRDVRNGVREVARIARHGRPVEPSIFHGMFRGLARGLVGGAIRRP